MINRKIRIYSVRLACVVLITANLSGCSTLEIAYRMADRLALRYVAGYTKLTNRQKGILAPEFEARMQEHERLELPQYVTLFRDAEHFAANGLTRDEIDQLLDDLNRLFSLLIDESVPLAVTTLQMLNDDQLNYFEQRLEKNLKDDTKDISRDPETRHSQRTENVVADIEKWTGKLNDAQVVLIAEHLADMPDTTKDWSRFRSYRNQRLLQTLRAGSSNRRLARVIRDGWVTRDMADEQSREKWAGNRNRYRELLVEFDLTMTKRQRKKMLRRFSKFANNLANLLPEGSDSDLVASVDR